jgi:receptor protein-tyrosine kinase
VLDNSVKGPEDFEALDVPVLGLVPFDKRTQQSVIAFRDDTHGTRAEAYRQMRTNLQFVSVDHAPKVIALTSAVPSEGKSTTSLNLAAALAEAGSKVVLVEADLRRPSLGKALGLSSDVGFTTALIHKAEVADVVQSIGPNLDILTSGPIPPNPSELLMTDQAKSILAHLRGTYDYVIVDTPPLLPVTDGAQIATIADATVLVYRAGKSSREAVKRCLIVLENVGVRPVGAILNMITKQRGSYYDYSYGYYYSYRPRAKHGVVEGQAQTTGVGG